MATRYIAYYRVSTVRQGESGLGLEAQRAATTSFMKSAGAELVSEFTEVESGKRANRPELAAAIQQCRNSGATLLIAKLDRLARNVHFISGLLESGVKFTAIDMPNADRFMMHVYAAMAEEEGRRISERTTAALAAAKARGVRLGVNGKVLAEKHKSRADTLARKVGPTLLRLKDDEGLTYKEIVARIACGALPNLSMLSCHVTTIHRLASRYRQLAAYPI